LLTINEFLWEFGYYIARVLDDVLGPLLPEGAESDNARRWAGRFMRGEI